MLLLSPWSYSSSVHFYLFFLLVLAFLYAVTIHPLPPPFTTLEKQAEIEIRREKIVKKEAIFLKFLSFCKHTRDINIRADREPSIQSDIHVRETYNKNGMYCTACTDYIFYPNVLQYHWRKKNTGRWMYKKTNYYCAPYIIHKYMVECFSPLLWAQRMISIFHIPLNNW